MSQGLVSLSDLARACGVSRQVISYAAKQGKITTHRVNGKPMVHLESAKAEFESNKLTRQGGPKPKPEPEPQPKPKKKKAVSRKIGSPVEPVKTKIVEIPKPIEVPTFQGMTTADAERKKKVYDARSAELKYLEQAGELVRADEVKEKAYEVARKTRDAILSLPARIAHEIAAETDPRQAELLLSRELVKCLKNLIGDENSG